MPAVARAKPASRPFAPASVIIRIQLSTRSLGSLVPGGSAASSALGFRMITLAGANGRDAGFALATAGIGSAVVLNLILWFGLIDYGMSGLTLVLIGL